MVFGKNKDKGIRARGLELEVVELGNGITEDDLLVHDETLDEPGQAYLLSRMTPPKFPVPMGVFRRVEKPTYADLMAGQIGEAIEKQGIGNLTALYRASDTWEVRDAPEGSRP
jgi:2-oxoglutarate ferredoxin oxidoreductase subunit beta